MKIVILAGGGGTRLFPLSRTCFPKQFLKVNNDKSLLAQTVMRFLPVVQPSDIIIVTNADYVYHVQSELEECNASAAHIVLEPAARNTAPAIALAMKYCMEELACTNDEVLLVTPADHMIKAEDLFVKAIKQAVQIAQNDKLITFGIKPDKPETGYGYIETGKVYDSGYEVVSFKEKPEFLVAQQYLEKGNYFWNSGMFAFSIGFMINEFEKYQPEIIAHLEKSYAEVLADFSSMPNISIDYAIAEKATAVVTLELPCYWNDIGSWDAMYEVLPKDDCGNAMHGDCLAIDCKNSLILGRDRLIAGIGLDDVLLVETDDVIVVSKKGESQKVKEVVGELKKRGRKEATEHTTAYRPWGSVTTLGEGPRYKMKKIRVQPKGVLSMQMHYHRSEHWIVIAGTAKVTIDGKETWVHENESIFVPQTTKHRLENPGQIPLEIIEIQNGSYVGEDDIVRFDE
ncbi:MAG: mannose-phosphate guanylyltransferase/mannose-6-phosphate isomerase [Massilibacillus sp.]|nr:mannose-phosphate guanylyltransferase/mannose-6-phosphate isomerase [Massilibacillus sp.]